MLNTFNKIVKWKKEKLYSQNYVMLWAHWFNGYSVQSQVELYKTQKMALDANLFNAPHFEIKMKGKVEKYREWSNALLYSLVQ